MLFILFLFFVTYLIFRFFQFRVTMAISLALIVALLTLVIKSFWYPKKEIKRDTSILRVGVEGVYYPWNFKNEKGNLDGFEIELAKEIAKESFKRVEFIVTPFDALIPGLLKGRYDVIISSVSATQERKKIVNFSDAYVATPMVFFAFSKGGKDFADLHTLKEVKNVLKGKILAVQGATLMHTFAKKYLGEAKIKVYQNYNAVALDLRSGRVDASLVELPFIVDLIKSKKGYYKFGPTINPEQFKGLGGSVAIAVRKGDVELLHEMNKILRKLKKRDYLKELSIKYFGVDLSV